MALIKKSFALRGHRTSIALEPEFWNALQAMVNAGWERNMTDLVLTIDMRRDPDQPLASALRVFALVSPSP